MTNKRFRPFSAYLTLILALATFVLTGLLSMTGIADTPKANDGPRPSLPFTEPPPLDAKIVEMMKTNTVGIVEARIHFVEKWEITPLQKAQVFLTMLTSAEGDDQRKLAHAALPYIGATNYGLARRYLHNPGLPKTVLSVFMTDTLKRSYEIKLPALVCLVQVEKHPLRKEAQELLRNYLGSDHGTNAQLWEEATLAWLKRNPQ